MKTLINIGTSQGNFQNIEFDKPFEEIETADIYDFLKLKFGRNTPSLHGWCLSPVLKKRFMVAQLVERSVEDAWDRCNHNIFVLEEESSFDTEIEAMVALQRSIATSERLTIIPFFEKVTP